MAFMSCLFGVGLAFVYMLRFDNIPIQGLNYDKYSADPAQSSTPLLSIETQTCSGGSNQGAMGPNWDTVEPSCPRCLTGTFYPTCDLATGKTYYSPCFGGCELYNVKSTPTFGNPQAVTIVPNPVFAGVNASCKCTAVGSKTTTVPGYCIDDPAGLGSAWMASRGLVSNQYKWRFPVFLTFFTLLIATFYFAFIPYLRLWIRVVDFPLRSQSMAISSIFVRVFGSVPGPIAVGYILDNFCNVWEVTQCGDKGACMVYDEKSGDVILWIIVGTRALNVILNGLITWLEGRKETDMGEEIEKTTTGQDNTAFTN